MTQSGERPPQRRSSRPNPNTGSRGTGEPMPYMIPQTRDNIPLARRDDALADDDLWDEPRQNTSAIRRDIQPPRRTTGVVPSPNTTANRRTQRTKDMPSPRQPRFRREPETAVKSKSTHWLFMVGLGMVTAVILFLLGSSLLAWGVQFYNGIRYGYPRTYQVDAVVGHGDSQQHPSHFIAINLNRQAVVVEFMGGDPAKTVTYVAPVYIAGDNGNLAPVTLEFRDVNGDGKPDMIIHIHLANQDQVSVFINDGTKFRPTNGTDKIRLN